MADLRQAKMEQKALSAQDVRDLIAEQGRLKEVEHLEKQRMKQLSAAEGKMGFHGCFFVCAYTWIGESMMMNKI